MAQPSSFVLTGPYNNPMDLFSLLDLKESLGMAPFSGQNVGAVGRVLSGKVYLGINVELPGLPLDHSIHAVQFLVTNLALNSERDLISHLAVSAKDSIFEAPCEQCCQLLHEMENPIMEILRKDTNKNINEYVTLNNLLPPPEALLLKEGRRLLDAKDNELTPLCPDIPQDRLVQRALAAAKKSYAPYSRCPSGIALKDSNKKVYRGWYMESRPYPYNPSVEPEFKGLGPVQAALVDFVIKGNIIFDTIVEAVLVEKQIPESAGCNLLDGIIQQSRDQLNQNISDTSLSLSSVWRAFVSCFGFPKSRFIIVQLMM